MIAINAIIRAIRDNRQETEHIVVINYRIRIDRDMEIAIMVTIVVEISMHKILIAIPLFNFLMGHSQIHQDHDKLHITKEQSYETSKTNTASCGIRMKWPSGRRTPLYLATK